MESGHDKAMFDVEIVATDYINPLNFLIIIEMERQE